MEPLRLSAFDEDDLQVISAHMQDAVMLTSDMNFTKRQRRFALIANRFVWERAQGKDKSQLERRRAGLHFEGVMAVKSHRIIQDKDDAVLSLLSIRFEKGDPPGGHIILDFSGGGIISLEVEFLEAWFRDLGPAWKTEHFPDHER